MSIERELSTEAMRELCSYPKGTLMRRCKNRIKRILRRPVTEISLFNWPCALLAIGLCEREKLLPDNDTEKGKIRKSLTAYFDRFVNQNEIIGSVEHLLAGTALCEGYRMTGEERYRNALFKFADFALTARTDERGGLVYNPARGNGYVLADMLGMACPFAYRYAALLGDEEPERARALTALATRQLTLFWELAVDQESGLPFHGYVLTSKEPAKTLGLLGWGRACGWLLMGLAYGVKYLSADAAEYVTIKQYYEVIKKTVMQYQGSDGALPWQLGGTDAHPDTSATAMLLYARLLAGDTLDASIQQGISYLQSQVKRGRVYGALAECVDVGIHPQVYGAYPWSLGPTLSAFSLVGGKGGNEL